jgi:hypothetical protein
VASGWEDLPEECLETPDENSPPPSSRPQSAATVTIAWSRRDRQGRPAVPIQWPSRVAVAPRRERAETPMAVCYRAATTPRGTRTNQHDRGALGILHQQRVMFAWGLLGYPPNRRSSSAADAGRG